MIFSQSVFSLHIHSKNVFPGMRRMEGKMIRVPQALLSLQAQADEKVAITFLVYSVLLVGLQK